MDENETDGLLVRHHSVGSINYDSTESCNDNRNLLSTAVPSKSSKTNYLRKTEKKKSSRTPFLIHSRAIHRVHSVDDIRALAQYSRYRYYAKLHGHKERIIIPDHVLPSYLFLPLPVKAAIEQGRQSSLITIFAIWNTMMGTSLLSMPWAITQSGLGLGIGIIIGMAGICLYTCILILRSAKTMDDSHKHEAFEFSDVCHYYLGKWGRLICIIFSIVALLGAAVVYWVLLSNFLYNVGKFIFDSTHPTVAMSNSNSSIGNLSMVAPGILCPDPNVIEKLPVSKLTPAREGIFFHLWQKQMTVPFFLVLLLFPLACLKSPTFFTKFNALGTLAVFYMMIFIIVKASSWKVNLYEETKNNGRVFSVEWANVQFPALSGTLGLALYIHNCILSITRNQVKPQHNTRDVCIAFALAGGTYLLMGVLIYICFPLAKTCIQQVLLDNFPTSDILNFTAQVFLLFQMVTVYPLLLYIIRVQLMSLLFGKVFPSWIHIIVLNALVVSLGIVFAVLYPHVGHIIRYVGSISALVYIFGLPPLITVVILRKKGQLTWIRTVFYSIIIFLGLINFILQFFVS